ncbi:MAG: ABC transporter permease [Firmicutes bacterium]|nr:ABC transporter permease [Bacillota bacterium]
MTEQAAAAVKQHEPWLRIVNRPVISRRKAWAIRAAAFIAAILCGALLILLLGHSPFAVYSEMIKGAVGSKISLVSTIKIAIPLLIAALSVALSFKMQFWNIGAEGQILAGGIAASYFALYWAGAMPALILFLLMCAAAAAAGALWGAIPALCKAKWNTNETLFTLMLNYVALGLIKYLQAGPWQKPGGHPQIAMFDDAARLPKIFDVHIGWIIAIVLVAVVSVFLSRSKHGFETAVVGQSPNTARYAGMHVGRVLVRTMIFAGALAGIVGFIQVSGADYTLTENTAGGVGFTAITVAWLAQLHPLAMMAVAVFIAVLEKGAGRIQTTYGIPASASDVLIGIILFFMLGCEFFIHYRLILRKGGKARG